MARQRRGGINVGNSIWRLLLFAVVWFLAYKFAGIIFI